MCGCLLSGVKRTSKFKSVTSAFDPKADIRRLTPNSSKVLMSDTMAPSCTSGADVRRRDLLALGGAGLAAGTCRPRRSRHQHLSSVSCGLHPPPMPKTLCWLSAKASTRLDLLRARIVDQCPLTGVKQTRHGHCGISVVESFATFADSSTSLGFLNL